MNNFRCRIVTLLLCQVVNIRFPVHVGHKSQTQCFIRFRKLIIAVRIQNNAETVYYGIPVGLNNCKYLIQDIIKNFIFFFGSCI